MFEFKNDSWITEFIPDNYRGQRLNFDLVDAKKNKVVAKAGEKITQRNIKKTQKSINKHRFKTKNLEK